VTTHVMEMVEAERARGFEGLAGSRVEGLVPVRQALVDAVLAQVPRWPAPVEALAVRIGDANRIHVSAAIRVLGFRTRVRLALRLAPALENGRIRLFLDDRSFMSSAVSWLGPLLGQLPGGVILHGNQITVDVQQFASRLGVADVAALLSAASFHSDEGVLWINARGDVPEGRAGERPAAESSPREAVPRASEGAAEAAARAASATRELPFTLDQLAAWLTGARVDVDVRLSERLANELVGAAHADAHTRAAAASGAPAVLGQSLRRPVLRFEQGTVRLTAGADLQPQSPAAGAEPLNV
jgi:hypothetical protein